MAKKHGRGRPSVGTTKPKGTTGAWAIRLPADLAADLDAAAERMGEGRATVVRLACREWIDRHSPTGHEKK